MFGIKTKLFSWLKNCIVEVFGFGITRDWYVSDLMVKFHVDEKGHRADKNNNNLGYGWVHYGLIRSLKPKRLLCIGSRHGYIPAIMAQACKDSKIGLVDFVDAGFDQDEANHWTGVGYWKTDKGINCFNRYGLNDWIKLHIMKSEKYIKQNSCKYKYIYIDGDHSYEGVKKDFQMCWPLLENGGFMVFHDINVVGKKVEGEYGVHKLWGELKSKYKGIQFVNAYSGLGLIQKE